MISVAKDIFIARPVGEVWDFINDTTRSAEWQSNVVDIRRDGELGVGTTATVRQKFMGRNMENAMECITCEPPNRLSWRSVSGPIEFTTSTKLVETEGGTNYSLLVEGEPGGFFKVASGLVAKQLDSTLEENMSALKSIMEG